MKNILLKITLLIFIFSFFSCKGKRKNKSINETQTITSKKNEIIISESEKPKIKTISKYEIDPYHYSQLSENYNEQQIDFSKEFLKIGINNSKKVYSEITNDIIKYSLDYNIFKTGDNFQNGIIGENYKRIKVYIKYSKRIENLDFLLVGKSNVLGNINSFEGKMKILSIFECKNDCDYEGQGTLYGEYELKEFANEKHSGIFKGTFECEIRINHKKRVIEFSDAFESADGYSNRTYVGTWKSYKTGKSKKCIWGDYRLPFTFDFDQGDGEMMINKKYINNGWKSFNNHSE